MSSRVTNMAWLVCRVFFLMMATIALCGFSFTGKPEHIAFAAVYALLSIACKPPAQVTQIFHGPVTIKAEGKAEGQATS